MSDRRFSEFMKQRQDEARYGEAVADFNASLCCTLCDLEAAEVVARQGQAEWWHVFGDFAVECGRRHSDYDSPVAAVQDARIKLENALLGCDDFGSLRDAAREAMWKLDAFLHPLHRG